MLPSGGNLGDASGEMTPGGFPQVSCLEDLFLRQGSGIFRPGSVKESTIRESFEALVLDESGGTLSSEKLEEVRVALVILAGKIKGKILKNDGN
jgi:hypothetical protein